MPDVDLLMPVAAATGALIGYARVSTRDQHLDRQLAALDEAGCSWVFADKLSFRNVDRPPLWPCLDYLRPGDVLVVAELSRLGRSLDDLLAIVAGLRKRGIGFRSLHEAAPARIETTGTEAFTGGGLDTRRPWRAVATRPPERALAGRRYSTTGSGRYLMAPRVTPLSTQRCART